MGAADEHPQHQPSPAPEGEAKRTLVFTYGTLKRGFSNHGLLQDLARAGDAAFVAAAATAEPLPLVCGPYRVPFLLNLPGEHGCQRVRGELYSVTPHGLARLDELEGVSRAHYERLPVSVVVDGGEGAAEEVVAYYAHRGYAAEMWARSGRRGHAEYSPAVAAGYVRRVDRPQHLTFLDQIRVFVSSQS
ncbi:putative gamma-glutamylcyclotransferase At3g02910 [Triticum urartu]|uniref:putative gamma-glutamylcyclotransferase At3g02910 n=1 Tax=Triticum urartu TaxID=4572 RepID=UPI0020438878|nr:putative gamma-glutamylcyclotransferase At3g02910 [Triticum urartu]